MSLSETFDLAFDDLFYNSRLWLALQNFFHSPLMLAILLALTFLVSGTGASDSTKFFRERQLQTLLAGCAVHTAFDISTHHNDGLLLLFPFDLSTRFSSPVSYWDPEYFGNLLQPVDMAITVLGGGWLLWHWATGRRSRR